jgi:hypothetical protein
VPTRLALRPEVVKCNVSFGIDTKGGRAPWLRSVASSQPCDKMDAAKPGSCRYTTDDKGLGGCTRNGCFYCPADGSRQCHATRTTAKPPTSGKPEFLVKIGSIHLACNRQEEGWCKADVVQR